MKTLIVYSPFTLIEDTKQGEEIAGEIMQVKWTAPFKDNDSLLKAIEDYSNRGFFCRVV